MSFQKKLFINSTAILVGLFSLFGLVMIIVFFKSNQKTILSGEYDNFKRLSNILASSDNYMDNSDLNSKLQELSFQYLNAAYKHNDDIFIANNDDIIYDSNRIAETAPKKILKINSDNISHYSSVTNGTHYLYIYTTTKINSESYKIIYQVNIQEHYEHLYKYVALLLIFDIITIFIATAFAYTFTSKVTNPLKEENMAKQRFIDGLTHEIRTPLTSIIGYSSILLQSKKDRDDIEHEALNFIHENGVRIQRLTESLVKLISLRNDKINLKMHSSFDLINYCIHSQKAFIEDNNINVEVSGNDFIINTDDDLFYILIGNLIQNAIKAMKDSETKDLKISIDKNRICIQDSGIGMDKDELKKIFEPFYMVNKSRKRSTGGFGLGLSLCQQIMSMLSIKYKINTELGKGTSIYLFF